MGLLDKLRDRLGSLTGDASRTADDRRSGGDPARDPDEVAVERYRYMLRTAPPETVEQAHAEAFAKLTPDQRRKVMEDLGAAVPAAERPASDDPQTLARTATRAEMSQPGTMERALGGGRGGMGMGGMIAGTLLASVAGAFVGTAIADAFLGDELGGDLTAGAEELAGVDAPVDPGAELSDAGLGDLGGMDSFDV